MNSDSGEDVMELCDVHANLFKNAIKGVSMLRIPNIQAILIRVFKDENLALRAALIRVRRLLDTYESIWKTRKCWRRCVRVGSPNGFMTSSTVTYQRKKRKSFSFNHGALWTWARLQKVMWEWMTKSNSIHLLLNLCQKTTIANVKETFEVLRPNLRVWFSKSLSLLMILLESFTQRWLVPRKVMLWLCWHPSVRKMRNQNVRALWGKKKEDLYS